MRGVLKFFEPRTFEGFQTSRTIKSTQLSLAEIEQAVEMGKFEVVPREHMSGKKLPQGFHGVNVFAVPEMKGRRRLITEPLVNACLDKRVLPRVNYPSRLGRRQSLRYAKYMLQIDFEAYYDAIPMPEEVRNMFVFRKGALHCRLKTLPTGARWSVAVGQAITWAIVDIDTPVIIHTMIDNIMIAAAHGQEVEFIKAVRQIVDRIRQANLLTTPDRETLELMPNEELLQEAIKPNTFLGEEYEWNGMERIIRNSVKTVAKLRLALEATRFSCRSFVSLVSLELYALHTTRLNPASAFQLLRAYRGVYRKVTEGLDWDAELPYLDEKVYAEMVRIGTMLVENKWWTITDEYYPTYDDRDYTHIVFTDASYGGWGAIVNNRLSGETTSYQQRWERGFFNTVEQYTTDMVRTRGFFNAQHSAHAEPKAAEISLRQLVREGIPRGSRIAMVTDHEAIVHAQRRSNGFGGIGRGYSLNKLFEYVNDLEYNENIRITFFHISGPLNPADTLSRVFGDNSADRTIVRLPAPTTVLPALSCTYSPVVEGLSFKSRQPRPQQ